MTETAMTKTLVPATFEKLTGRHRVRAELEARTALRIGAGKSFDVAATDQPVIRDGFGRPFLPGSSLKGALRSGLEALLRGLGSEVLNACDPLHEEDSCGAKLRALQKERDREPPIETIQKELCVVCGLFGSSFLAGRLFIHDLPVVGGASGSAPPVSEVRDGVGIHRDLKTAQRGVKYDFEALPPGTGFELEMLLENGSAEHWALVLKTLELLDQGEILIGGLTSRGLGRMGLAPGTVELERTDAKRLLDGQGYEKLVYETELEKAGEVLMHRLEGGS